MTAPNDKDIFLNIDFTILLSDQLDELQATKLKAILEGNGAQYIPLLPTGRIDDVSQHSHIISTHVNFPEYNSTLDHHVHVVKPSWVSQSVLRKRMAQPRQHSPDPVLFFSDVVITCADLPSGDKDAITAGVMAMGGMYSNPMTKLVTHVVSLSEQHEKVQIVRNKNLDCKVVLPHWFDDCLKLGRKISETPYMLPNPEILDYQSTKGPIMHCRPSDLSGAVTAVAGPVPRLTPPPDSLEMPSTPRKKLDAFRGRTFFFSKDLNINDRLARTLEELVQRGGGTMTQAIQDCDTYVGHFRDGEDYKSASQAGKVVANLAWFYNVVTRNCWTNPVNKLLHYPVPRDGIPGFKGLKIALSNYTGESRQYLENLVNEAGGEFTRTMKQDNTHLITAHPQSEKCDAAQEWNINIVNHIWLEESYAKCAIQSLTNSRYTHFPARTNLSEIVGQTPIDLGRVQETFFSTNERTIKDNEHDGLNMKDTRTPHPYRGAVKPRPSPRKTVPASSVIANEPQHPLVVDVHQDGEDEEDEDDQRDTEEKARHATPVPKSQKKKSRASSAAAEQTPSARHGALAQENSSPPTTSSRRSKQRALENIAASAPDVALFEKQMKQKGGVTHGKKRSSAEAEEPNAAEGHVSDVEVRMPATKKAKADSKKEKTDFKIPLPPVKYRMLVSGDERWLGEHRKEAEDKKTLRSLGIALTTNPADCTLLCVPKILRTRKFVAALANAPEVVNTGYLDYALRHNALHDTNHFYLYDREIEEKLGFRLSDSLKRAKENSHKLLRGWTIFVTDHVPGGFDTYQDIISRNGGKAVPYRGRTGVVLPPRRLRMDEDPDAGLESQNQGGDVETDYVYLVSGTEDDDVKIWPIFRKLAEKQGVQARVVTNEWLLNLAMGQKVEWDDKWELKEELVPGFEGRRR